LILPLVALSSACGPIVDPEGAWAEVGVGSEEFLPLADGTVLQVERGSQGGMHIWVSARTYGIAPGPTEMWQGLVDGSLPIVRFELESDEGVLTADIERPYVLRRLGNSEYDLLENLVQFDHFPELPENWQELDWAEVEADLEGVDIALSVRFTDSEGTVVQDKRTVRLDFPSRDEDQPGR
jgi:hypothetical protein